jgi:co-chaperonin GroES (HSP10)
VSIMTASSMIDLSKSKVTEQKKKKVTYKPLFARVLIERQIHEKIGNVLLPENIQKRHAKCEGIVVDKGPTADASIPIGAHVIFGRHAGTWLDATYSLTRNAQGQQMPVVSDNDDGTMFLCQDEDILCVIEDEQGE